MPSTTRLTRRTALALAVSLPLAGCTGLLGDDTLLEETLTDDEPGAFEADEGDDLEVTVAPEDDESVNVQILGTTSAFAGPLVAASVEGEETLEATVETDDEYAVTVTGGSAHVTVERS